MYTFLDKLESETNDIKMFSMSGYQKTITLAITLASITKLTFYSRGVTSHVFWFSCQNGNKY